jgi:hypothetical protein
LFFDGSVIGAAIGVAGVAAGFAASGAAEASGLGSVALHASMRCFVSAWKFSSGFAAARSRP